MIGKQKGYLVLVEFKSDQNGIESAKVFQILGYKHLGSNQTKMGLKVDRYTSSLLLSPVLFKSDQNGIESVDRLMVI